MKENNRPYDDYVSAFQGCFRERFQAMLFSFSYEHNYLVSIRRETITKKLKGILNVFACTELHVEKVKFYFYRGIHFTSTKESMH